MVETLEKLSADILYGMEDIHEQSPDWVANLLLQYWTPDCLDEDCLGKPLYCEEEKVMLRLAITFMRHVVLAMRADRRARIRKHMLASLKPDADLWCEDFLASGGAEKQVQQLLSQFGL